MEITVGGCSARSADYVYLVTANEEDQHRQVEIYPNPVNDKLMVRIPSDSEVAIYDLSGKPTFRARLKFSDVTEITTNEWQPGFYIVNIRSNRINHSFKVLKIN